MYCVAPAGHRQRYRPAQVLWLSSGPLLRRKRAQGVTSFRRSKSLPSPGKFTPRQLPCPSRSQTQLPTATPPPMQPPVLVNVARISIPRPLSLWCPSCDPVLPIKVYFLHFDIRLGSMDTAAASSSGRLCRVVESPATIRRAHSGALLDFSTTTPHPALAFSFAHSSPLS